MRIAIVVPQFAYPRTGGVGPHGRKLAEALSAAGDEVLVVSDGAIERGASFDVASVGMRWTVPAAFRALATIGRFRADAAVFEYTPFNFGARTFAPFLLALTLRARGVRVGAFIHEIFYRPGSAAAPSLWKAALLAVRDALFLATVRDTYVANAAKQMRLLRLAPFLRSKRMHVIPIGANIEPAAGRIWNGGDAGRSSIVSFGVIMPRRRHELLIEAVARLVASGRDIELHLVGNLFDLEYAERCRELARERDIADRVSFSGGVADDEVSRALQECALAAYALEDGLISSSGSLLAGFAHGAPVVATSSPGDEADLAACVRRVPPDAAALSKALASLLDDLPERQRLSERGLRLYQDRFSWDAIAATLHEALTARDGSRPQPAPILLTNEPTSEPGGIQRYVARLAAAYASAGKDVVLVEPASKHPATAIAGVRYRRFGGASRPIAMAAALRAYVWTLVTTRRRSTIASIWFPSGLVAALVPRLLRGRLAILAHGTEIAPHAKGLRLALMRWTYRRADVIVANSALTQGLLAAAGVRDNVAIVHCGVDARPLVRRTADIPTVLAVGRLVPRKGFDRTIEAMPAVLSAVPDARYRIVGDGPQRAELEALAARLGVSTHVDFLGAVSDAELEAEYARAWCFAMPSRRIGDDVEGFGIVYLEAAIAGLAAIGGAGSGAEDAIADGRTGAIVDGNDPAAIAAAIIELLSHREQAERLGQAARERALRDFDWTQKAQAIERISIKS